MISHKIINNIAYIEINDGKANVFNKDSANALINTLNTVAESEDIKATILCPAGDKFCAGYDLTVMQKNKEERDAMVAAGFNMLYHLYSHPLPLIAMCNGHAIGLGAFILLCCDTRIGIEGDYKIGLPETAGGMPFPPLLITALRERLTPSFLTPVALQSQMLDAKTAIKASFLDMLVPAEQLKSTAETGATMLMQLPTKQYGENKLSLRQPALQAMLTELEKLDLH